MGTSSMMYIENQGSTVLSTLTSKDGGPRMEGRDLMAFLAVPSNVESIRLALKTCKFIPDQSVQVQRIANGHEWELEYMADHPDYTISTGVRLLEEMASNPRARRKVRSWSGDMRMNDWAYVVDLDEEVLEVYRGMNRIPPKDGERFYDGGGPDADGCYPFRKVAAFGFSDPSSCSRFVEECEGIVHADGGYVNPAVSFIDALMRRDGPMMAKALEDVLAEEGPFDTERELIDRIAVMTPAVGSCETDAVLSGGCADIMLSYKRRGDRPILFSIAIAPHDAELSDASAEQVVKLRRMVERDGILEAATIVGIAVRERRVHVRLDTAGDAVLEHIGLKLT